MKILIDENLPPCLARALGELFKGEHEVIHLRDRFGPKVKDTEWIPTLAGEGRWIVISEDRRITKNRAEYSAFMNAQMKRFFLSKGLHKAKFLKKVEKIIFYWDDIIEFSSRMAGGAMFELPVSGSVRQLRI